MKVVSVLVGICICLSCNTVKNTSSLQNSLNGNWIPVRQEIGGNELPATAFANQLLFIKDSTYVFTAESVDKGVVKYSSTTMDIYSKEGVNTGIHFMTIYKYENELLTICYNLKGDSYPTVFETKNKPGYFISVYKKISK